MCRYMWEGGGGKGGGLMRCRLRWSIWGFNEM